MRASMIALVLAALPAEFCAAETAPAPATLSPPTATAGVDRLSWSVGDDSVLTLQPGSDLYPRYLADPRRPRFGLGILHTFNSGLPESAKTRINAEAGARVPLLRIHPWEDAERGFQLDADVGIFSQFDAGNALDDVGWDGVYAVNLSYFPGGPFRFKVGQKHLSAHVGDRFIARTGVQEPKYTREEFTFATAFTPNASWTAYAEFGWAYHLASARQRKGGLELGLQYDSPLVLWDGRAGYYAAIDSHQFEEDGWRPNLTMQVGLNLPLPLVRHRYRVGIEGYTGRAVLGEFSRLDESYALLGFWFDL